MNRFTAQQGNDLANETDFLDLYRRLELGPDCGLAEFKQAYRRHVALLHPDRQAETHRQSSDTDSLRKLIAQYGAAMEFQRRHGRLPGAAAVPARSTVSPPASGASRSQPLRRSDARRKYSWLTVLLGLLATGVLLWNVTAPAPQAASASASTADETNGFTPPPITPKALPSLYLGMPADDVRSIEGEPIDILGERWEYGPSWIAFKHDKVIDWYSSPLNALQTPLSRPSSTVRKPPCSPAAACL